MRYVMIGAGGHGKVLASVARKQNWELVAVLDDAVPAGTISHQGALVYGPFDRRAELSSDFAFLIGVGDNAVRDKFYNALKAEGRNLPSLVDPSATIDDDVTLGEATVVLPGVVMAAGTAVGANSIINTGASLDVDCQIGNHVHVAPGVRLGSGVRIDDHVFLGIGSVVGPNLQVGQGAVVGAGGVVFEDVPKLKLALGNPARISRDLAE